MVFKIFWCHAFYITRRFVIAAIFLLSVRDLPALDRVVGEDDPGYPNAASTDSIGCRPECALDEFCDIASISRCVKCSECPCRPGLSERDCQAACPRE